MPGVHQAKENAALELRGYKRSNLIIEERIMKSDIKKVPPAVLLSI